VRISGTTAVAKRWTPGIATIIRVTDEREVQRTLADFSGVIRSDLCRVDLPRSFHRCGENIGTVIATYGQCEELSCESEFRDGLVLA
jgi:hypothetical protein